jgi:hypothetical protein
VATRDYPQLIQFLNRPDISFASVDKRQDTPKLEALGAHIPNHVDLQDHFSVPFQARTGLTTMAKEIIDKKFKDHKEDFRKLKLHNTWHLWELRPEHIHYAVKDAYVCYDAFYRITIVRRCMRPLPQY